MSETAIQGSPAFSLLSLDYAITQISRESNGESWALLLTVAPENAIRAVRIVWDLCHLSGQVLVKVDRELSCDEWRLQALIPGDLSLYSAGR